MTSPRTLACATLVLASLAARAEPMGDDMGSMASARGPYEMTRDASGTAWQPEGTPMTGLMWHAMPWMVMAHGIVNAVYDDQGGPRGGTKRFSSSMFMAMGSRALGPGTLELRAMLSLDPAMGASGYPLLFQAGETANGVTPLVDRQHPHDAFMEFAGSYSVVLDDESALYAYAGLPGEAALGPPAFQHRFSGARNPEAPLAHHWLDSTHISMGVVTLGASRGGWKVEASRFNAREPDQARWNIETGKLDATSARVTFNPSRMWSMQASYGDLRSPERLEPDVRVKRTTASVMLQAEALGRPWGTTLAWGRNRKQSSAGTRNLNAWLLESTLEVSAADTVFGRIERIEQDELFGEDDPLHGRAFPVGKLTLGYIRDVLRTGPVRWSVGALGSAFHIPDELRAAYGAHPHAYMAFLQARFQ